MLALKQRRTQSRWYGNIERYASSSGALPTHFTSIAVHWGMVMTFPQPFSSYLPLMLFKFNATHWAEQSEFRKDFQHHSVPVSLQGRSENRWRGASANYAGKENVRITSPRTPMSTKRCEQCGRATAAHLPRCMYCGLGGSVQNRTPEEDAKIDILISKASRESDISDLEMPCLIWLRPNRNTLGLSQTRSFQ